MAFTASVDGLVSVKESEGDPVNAHDTPDMIAMAMQGQTVDIVAKLAIEGTTEKSYTCKCVVDTFEVSETVAQKSDLQGLVQGLRLGSGGVTGRI